MDEIFSIIQAGEKLSSNSLYLALIDVDKGDLSKRDWLAWQKGVQFREWNIAVAKWLSEYGRVPNNIDDPRWWTGIFTAAVAQGIIEPQRDPATIGRVPTTSVLMDGGPRRSVLDGGPRAGEKSRARVVGAPPPTAAPVAQVPAAPVAQVPAAPVAQVPAAPVAQVPEVLTPSVARSVSLPRSAAVIPAGAAVPLLPDPELVPAELRGSMPALGDGFGPHPADKLGMWGRMESVDRWLGGYAVLRAVDRGIGAEFMSIVEAWLSAKTAAGMTPTTGRWLASMIARLTSEQQDALFNAFGYVRKGEEPPAVEAVDDSEELRVCDERMARLQALEASTGLPNTLMRTLLDGNPAWVPALYLANNYAPIVPIGLTAALWALRSVDRQMATDILVHVLAMLYAPFEPVLGDAKVTPDPPASADPSPRPSES